MEQESVITKASRHITMVQDMRTYAISLKEIAKRHHKEKVKWANLTITEVADYAQNLGMPHFGSEQPGDLYYYSDLSVYVYGVAREYTDLETLTAYYYTEDIGKKGGNNVASLLLKKMKIQGWIEKKQN